VLPVVFFHARVAGFSGGFVGVDIFYVISGYLITALIAKDIALGRFSVVSFYERRIRRIFPALFAVMFASTLAACALFSPQDFIAFGKSMIAATLFVSNVFFKHAAGTGGYFGPSSDSRVLLHTWSLSVEEQFYLLFPTALLLLARWAKRQAISILLVIAVGSFFISVWTAQYRPLTAFYIFIPRAWELLIGSLLAIKTVPPLTRRALREITGLAGLGLIAWAVFIFNKDTTFPGLAALLPCLGAWLVIYSGENGPSCVKTILSFRPLVFVGIISYSLYLWHWPIIVFSRYFSAGELSGLETATVIIVSLAVAFISFEFIEKPFRGADSKVKGRQIFKLGIAASMLSLVIGFAIYWHHGFPGRYDELTRQLILENTERKDDFLEECSNFRKEFHSISDITFCKLEPKHLGPNSAKAIMFWGDSHVQQLYPLIKKMHDDGELQGHGVVLAIANGCPPTEHLNSIEKGYHCDSFATLAMTRAEQEDVDTVFIAFNTWWSSHEFICTSVEGRCVGRLSPEEARRQFLSQLSDQIHRLRISGKRVIVSLPFPMFDKSIPDLEIRNAVFGRFGLGGVAKDITLPGFRNEVASAAKNAGAEIFDPRESLCDEQQCITQVNGVSIYKDDNHIAASQIGILGDNLKQVLR
jgi:peptidoglycan/LPS O-acetylase OafA/YrhL